MVLHHCTGNNGADQQDNGAAQGINHTEASHQQRNTNQNQFYSFPVGFRNGNPSTYIYDHQNAADDHSGHTRDQTDQGLLEQISQHTGKHTEKKDRNKNID